MKIILNRLYCFSVCFFSIINAEGQSFFATKKYPTHDFINPLQIPYSLVGNFGECRPNHFHSGIDFRTNSQENLPVLAIADGYVSKVTIEASGFGNAIYVTHANGFISLYAHLNSFYKPLQEYVIQKQYEEQTWKTTIHFLPHQFPVQKGKVIARSGNTGHSSGPHLHLEIRDHKTNNPLNGLLFFNDIPDNKKPIIKQLAMYDGTKSIYEQSPKLFGVQNEKLSQNIVKTSASKVYFGIQADDLMEVSKGILGVYEMRLFVNDKPYFGWQMDNISYDITRYMNAIADYKTQKQKSIWIQLCRQLPNDKLPIYKSFNEANGVIDLSDGQIKKIRIEAADVKGNYTKLEYQIQLENPSNNRIECTHYLKAGKSNFIKTDHIEIQMDKDALYDDVCFIAKTNKSIKTYSYLYQLHTTEVPLHSPIDISLTPKMSIPKEKANKVAIMSSNTKHGSKGKAAMMIYGRVFASIKELGTYEIAIDEKPPTIQSSIKNNDDVSRIKRLSFEIKEETTSIKKVTATIDGKWLRMVQKGNQFYYEMDDKFPKGKHQLTVTATDENNNEQKLILTLNKK